MITVCVNFLTYTPSLDHPRAMYAKRCLEALLKNLSFKEGNLIYHIADDGSPHGHVTELMQLCTEYNVPHTYSKSERLGYGGNMNLATQTIHSISDMVLPVEEDWELVHKLDIGGLVRAIQESEEIECVRLGYLGWTNDLRGKVVQSANQSFLLFDPDSPEVHVFAGHPRLETVSFEKRIGEWPVGIKAGFVEMEICNRPEARKGVAWPLDADINASQDYCSMFAHIGNFSV